MENLICSTPDPYCLTESVVYGNSDGMNEIPNNTKYGQIKNSIKVPVEYSVISLRARSDISAFKWVSRIIWWTEKIEKNKSTRGIQTGPLDSIR